MKYRVGGGGVAGILKMFRGICTNRKTENFVYLQSFTMDIFDNVFADLQILQQLQQNPPNPPVFLRRTNPMEELSEAEFLRHFRFNKRAVGHLVDMFRDQLQHNSRRGRPLTPELQVCIALNHYAGANFQRISAYCAGVSQATAWRAIDKVTRAICSRKAEFIRMPSEEEMRRTAQRMEEKFNLPRFAFAVDGVMVRFDYEPRDIPHGTEVRNYWCRKQYYAINCQVIANDQKIIYDIDCDWPGCAHDGRVWRRSGVKQFLERQHFYLLAGDSAYTISEILMKPYSNAEALGDASKRLFNGRLSGLRTVMSENVYGIWKKRFPILREMRSHLPSAQMIIVATAILHNIAVRENMEEPPEDLRHRDNRDGDSSDDDSEPEENVQHRRGHGEGLGDAVSRIRGQRVREMLRENQPPRRRNERY